MARNCATERARGITRRPADNRAAGNPPRNRRLPAGRQPHSTEDNPKAVKAVNAHISIIGAPPGGWAIIYHLRSPRSAGRTLEALLAILCAMPTHFIKNIRLR